MKYSAVFCILILLTCGCNNNEASTTLLNEQKTLRDNSNKMTTLLNEQKAFKDSAYNTIELIGRYIQKGMSDSETAQKKRLGAIHAHLASIQSSIDSLKEIK
jgi:hypothetical protein